MEDANSGRSVARRFTIWGLLNLLAGGPLLALLAAYDATVDGNLSLHYPIFGTHSWLVLMGWCVPVTFALVFWLLPILKDVRDVRYGTSYNVCLALLVIPTLGLGAYLLLAHLGLPALFILPMVWGCFLTASILYATIVWRVCARTLRPTASDIGLLSGAVWLLVIMVVRVITALGAVATNRHDFLASSEPAVIIAMTFGFLGNTGLALASAIGPEFLLTSHARPTVTTAFRLYNTAVGIWCGGALWVLPVPYGFGRLMLAVSGFFFAYAATRLLVELRLFDLLLLRANSARRRLARTALGSAAVLMGLAIVNVTLIGLWIGGTMSPAPRELVVLPMHLMAAGFFSCIVIGLYVPLLGPQSLKGGRLFLAYAAYVLTLLWLLGRVGLSIMQIIGSQPFWYQRYYFGWTIAAGSVALALWLILAMSLPRRPQPLAPPAGSPPPSID